MAPLPQVLVLGGTGRTGRYVLQQLLTREVRVRAIVRSADRLPAECSKHPNMETAEAELMALSEAEMLRHLLGCEAVVSCLGHTASLKGVFGPPLDLVTRATRMVFHAARTLNAASPLRYVLMSSVSVNHPAGLDPRRRLLERIVLWALRTVLPPARDNQGAADFLVHDVGAASRQMEWVIVRPDSLIEGERSDYSLHPTLVSSLFTADDAAIANVAHFMCELVCVAEVWRKWKGGLPVIVNAPSE